MTRLQRSFVVEQQKKRKEQFGFDTVKKNTVSFFFQWRNKQYTWGILLLACTVLDGIDISLDTSEIATKSFNKSW